MWFQNRRMKHKRQTLSKQNDDGDDKDSISSDGAKSTKMSDKLLGDELSKKSCQGCEMPPAAVCGPHDEVVDLGSSRGNNNNTPSATNNNTNFSNTNSNGASSIASSGSLDKIISEEDSQSNEDPVSRGSPRIPKKGGVSIKSEFKRESPGSMDRRIGTCKMSPSLPGSKEAAGVSASTDILSKKMNAKCMTASSSTTPAAVHISPVGMGSTGNPMYSHVQRSSPTTATAIASATVTIQNVSNAMPPFASRGSQIANNFQGNYQQLHNQLEYRTDSRIKHHQQQYPMGTHTGYVQSDMYNPEPTSVNEPHPYYRNQMNSNAMAGGHHDASKEEMSLRAGGRTRHGYHAPYSNPSQQHYYNYNKRHSSDTFQHNLSGNQAVYPHGYQEHAQYNHYGYPAVYSGDGSENMGSHVAGHMNHGHDSSANYYQGQAENMHSLQKVPNHAEYPNKLNYYEGGGYSTPQAAAHESSGYISSEAFSNSNTPTALSNAPPAMAASAVMTPPASVQTDSSDTYSSFHQYYGDNPQNHVPPVGENSNSSSDFNFLSNLANDFTPEYYQI